MEWGASEGVLFVYSGGSRFDVSMKNIKRKSKLTQIVYERRNHKKCDKGAGSVFVMIAQVAQRSKQVIHGKMLPVICGVYTVQTRAK